MTSTMNKSIIYLLMAYPVWVFGGYDTGLKFGDKPPENSCEIPTWEDIDIKVTSVPEPRGGPDGSICNASVPTGYVEVIEWMCLERFCCSTQCTCDCKADSPVCPSADPSFQPQKTICLCQQKYTRLYKRECCNGYHEGEDAWCTKNIPEEHGDTDDDESPDILLIISLLLVLCICIIIGLVIGFLLYRRKKRKELEKVIFSTSGYDNDSYDIAHPRGSAASADGPIPVKNLHVGIPEKDKSEIMLRIDHCAVNPLYERDKDEYNYPHLPDYPTDEKSGMADYLSSSPYVSGLPTYEKLSGHSNIPPMHHGSINTPPRKGRLAYDADPLTSKESNDDIYMQNEEVYDEIK